MGKKQAGTLWPACAMAIGLLAPTVWAQIPVPPSGPAIPVESTRGGPIRRFLRHTGHVLQDNLIGYPEEFIVPPFGATVTEPFHLMKAKAAPHQFTLYHTDFLDGTDRFSPNGAARFNLMAARLPGWLGPLIIEWSPDRPGLAESRRAAVLATLERANLPVIPERLLIAPSPYPGAIGINAANNYGVMIQRNLAAPDSFALPPVFVDDVSDAIGGSQ